MYFQIAVAFGQHCGKKKTQPRSGCWALCLALLFPEYYLCMCVCVQVWGCPRRPAMGMRSPYPTWVLGTKLWLLAGAASAPRSSSHFSSPLVLFGCHFPINCAFPVCQSDSGSIQRRPSPPPGPLAPVSFCCCDKDQDPKQHGEERVGPSSSSQVHHWGSQGRDHCGAHGGLWLALFAFLFLPGPWNHRYHCPQWAEPFHINHQEMPHIFSVEIPSQVTSAVSSGHKTWPAHPSGFSLFVLAQTLLTPG